MSDLTTKIVITAEDKTRGAIDSVRQGVNSIDQAIGRIRERVGQAFAIGSITLAAREISRLGDTYQSLAARVRVTGAALGESNAQLKELFAISQRNFVSFEGTANLFSRIAIASQNLKASQEDVLGVVEAVGQALKISGATTAEATGVMVQFSQALASSGSIGQELNSILEQSPRLAKAIADGLGTTTDKLKKLNEQQVLTGPLLFKALQSQQKALAGEAAGFPLTVAKGIELVKDAVLKYVGEAREASVISAAITSGLQSIARNFDTIGAGIVATGGVIAAVFAGRMVGAIQAFIVTKIAAIATMRQAQAAAVALALSNQTLATSQLASAQAAALQAGAVARVGPAAAGVAAAQASLAAATLAVGQAKSAASVATSIFSRALTALGGPIGAIITLLGVAGLAFSLFGNRVAKSANEQLVDAKKRFDEMIVSQQGAFAQQTRGEQARVTAAQGELTTLRSDLAKERETLQTLERRNAEAIAGKNPQLAASTAQRLRGQRELIEGLQSQVGESETLVTQLGKNIAKIKEFETTAAGSIPAGARDLGRAQLNAIAKKFQTDADEMAEAMRELRDAAKGAGVSEQSAEFERIAGNIRDKFTKNPRKTKKDKEEPNLASNEFALAKSLAENEARLETDANAFQQKLLEQQRDRQLISLAEFYRRRLLLTNASIDAELKAKRIEELEAQRSVNVDDDGREQIETKKRLADVRGEIAVLEQKRVQASIESQLAETDSADDLLKKLDEIRTRVADTTGTLTDDQRRQNIVAGYADMVKQLEALGADTSPIKRLIDVEVAQQRLRDLEAAYAQSMQRLRNTEDSINVRRNAELVSSIGAREELIVAQRLAASEMSKLIPEMERAAEVVGTPELKTKIEGFRVEVQRLSTHTNELQNAIAGKLNDSFGNFFSGVVTGTSNIKNAFQNLFKSISQGILDLISRRLGLQLLESLFPSDGKTAGGANGVVGWVATFLKGLGGSGNNNPTGDHPSVAHMGGVIGSGSASVTRWEPLSLWRGAPRLHEGGEVRTILEKGEEVLTKDDPRHVRNGGGGMVVNVNNYGNDKVTTRESNEGGVPTLDIMIEQVEKRIAGNVAQGRGTLARSMQSTYGLNRAQGKS